MSALPTAEQPMTEAEYLAFERTSEIKHEFFDCEIYAMSGASRSHNLIAGSTYVALYTQLRGQPCEVYPANMKVRTPATRSYFYPDISVVCGDVRLDDGDILLNPTLIVEILSPSTERNDRGRKFQHYRELESLREYVLIAQDSPHIERFTRQENGLWLFGEAHGRDAVLDLAAIGCTLVLADIYEQVDFAPTEADDEPA